MKWRSEWKEIELDLDCGSSKFYPVLTFYCFLTSLSLSIHIYKVGIIILA